MPGGGGVSDTRELVERAQAGDREAFAELYRLHHSDVFWVIVRRVGDLDLADDLTADVWERAWRNLPRFSWRSGGFGAWLTVIAVNLCRDWARSSRRRMETLAGDDSLTAACRPDTDRRYDPEQVAVVNSDAAALNAVLATLTEWQRRVLALRFGRGLTAAEAADAMGCTTGAVKLAQHRATGALRKRLGGGA